MERISDAIDEMLTNVSIKGVRMMQVLHLIQARALEELGRVSAVLVCQCCFVVTVVGKRVGGTIRGPLPLMLLFV